MPRVVFTSGSSRQGSAPELVGEYFTVKPDVIGAGDKTITAELSISAFDGTPTVRIRYPAGSSLSTPSGTIITSGAPVGVGRFTLTGTINVAAGTPANVALTVQGTTGLFRFVVTWSIDY